MWRVGGREREGEGKGDMLAGNGVCVRERELLLHAQAQK